MPFFLFLLEKERFVRRERRCWWNKKLIEKRLQKEERQIKGETESGTTVLPEREKPYDRMVEAGWRWKVKKGR